ncbi:MAG TPA: hypothetical protein VM658_04980 [bacterium]|nr:hypothetical protein [bacterium]
MAQKPVKDQDDRLGSYLIRQKIITPAQLDQAVQCQVLFGGRLGTNLLELGFITEEKLRRLLEEKYKVDSISRSDLNEIAAEVVALVSREVADRHKLVPLRAREGGLEVAMLDPFRESAMNALSEITTLKILPLIALELDLLWALEKYYAVKREARFVNLDRWLEQQAAARREPRKKKAEAGKAEPLLPDPQSITAQEGAPRSLDDFWDRVGRTGHPEYLLPHKLQDLQQATNRNQIARTILDFASMTFSRALLFVVNGDMLFGWDGAGQAVNSRTALAIMLPLNRRSVFKTVLETGAYYLGPIPDSPINRRFLAALGPSRPKTALLIPIMVSGKTAAILYGDMGHEQGVDVKLSPLQTILNAAGQALQRIILKTKSENPKPPP